MRSFFLPIFLIICLQIDAQSILNEYVTFKEGDLPSVFESIETSKKLQLERMTSLEFHNLLNKYRSKRGKKALFWDDRLWLASRNHNIYQLNCSRSIKHGESNRCQFFTGKEPWDRVQYVTYGNKDFEMAGFENVAQYGEWDSKNLDFTFADNLSWDEMVVQAKKDAEDMFDLWRNSSAHNRNMLDSDHLAHGTSIIYENISGATIGTSVFTHKQEHYEPDTLKLDFHEGWESDFKVSFHEKYHDFKPYPNETDRIALKYFKSFASSIEQLGADPNQNLYELLMSSPEGEDDKALRKRYLKSTYFIGILKLFKYDINQQLFEVKLNRKEMNSLKGIGYLNDYLSDTQELKNAEYWAGDLNLIKENENEYTLRLKTYSLARRQ